MVPRAAAALFACLLAGGLGAGGASGGARGVAASPPPSSALAVVPAAAAPRPGSAGPAVAPTRAVPAPAAFPYAPGGDDLLAGDDVTPPASAAAAPPGGGTPVRAAPSPSGSRRVRVPLPPALDVPAEFLGAPRDVRFVLDPVHGATFLERDEHDRWHDRSAELLDDDARAGCPGAAGLAVADFNGDGRPDVFVACDGAQLLFLSSTAGRYARVETAFVLRASAPVAADLDGDGRVDVQLLDAGRALALYGRGDGSFALGSLSGRGSR